MIVNFTILTLLAVITVFSVRFLLINGVDKLCNYFKLSSKSKGQIIGYSTSIPEFTVVVSSAFAGVFEAGLWNIASSNIINWVLFAMAVLFYGQQKDMLNKKFIEEIVFATVAVLIPLFLSLFKIGLNLPMALGLIVLFVIYKIIDRLLNPKDEDSSTQASEKPNVLAGIVLLFVGILLVVVCGKYLGQYSEKLINQIGIPAWAIGWILGFITSLPEMTSFFEIFRIHKKRGTLHLTDDMQEALDTLVASNCANLGIILPIGLIIFTLVAL
jgi:Ca2+/Na+ antiporter